MMLFDEESIMKYGHHKELLKLEGKCFKVF